MKEYLYLLLIILMLAVSCTESVNESEPIDDEEQLVDYSSELEKLFPVKIGDSFNYLVDTLNLQSKTYDNIGSREVNVQEKEATSNVYLCLEQYDILSSVFQSQSKFRINENSIEFFYDSTGVTDLIPDSIDIKLTIDKSFKLVEYPYEKEKKWSVFKAGADFGAFKFAVFSITGEYLESEDIQLTSFESTVNAEKIKFLIDINLPDISNPFISNIQHYSATVWFSPEIGLVKLEGCAMFVNPITGRNFDIADSNKVIRHSLIKD